MKKKKEQNWWEGEGAQEVWWNMKKGERENNKTKQD